MIVMRPVLRAVVAGVATAAVVTLAGCGNSAADDPAGGGDKLNVVASFYPLEFIAKTVGGDAVHVTTLTAPGVEPHDLELTPKQVGHIAEAKLVLFEGNLQPAVDEAIDQNAKKSAFDVASAASLEATGADFEQHPEDGAGPAVKPAAYSEDALDPHFWLDPVRYADVVKAITGKLVETDPANADGYRERSAAMLTDVTKLDNDFKTGLANCKLKTFVTSHQAFAYLAKRYGLQMVGIAGFTPDAEPTPQRIREVQDIVREQKVSTIFYEELVSPKVAESIARDVHVKTAVLSPIEGLPDANSQESYLSLMRANLQELRKANSCA
jgi:zinc transport system substrate-binding protein